MAFSIDVPRLAFDTPTGVATGPPRVLRVYLALAALQVLDVATTWVILANWTARAEGNPIVAGLIDHTGLVVSMIALLVIKLSVVRVLYEKQTGVKLMSAVYSLVVANNSLFLVLWLFG